MKIQGTYRINIERERVFSALIDPKILQRCIPGCESLEKTADNDYVATMKAGVGAVKGTFKGHVRLEDVQAPTHYKMIVEGKGTPGFAKGTGEFNLTEDDGAATIAYTGEMQVGGVIASVGQRMIEAAAKMLAAKFFSELEKQIGSNMQP
jgi:carbon monoxide dehydrogenase subunit G